MRIFIRQTGLSIFQKILKDERLSSAFTWITCYAEQLYGTQLNMNHRVKSKIASPLVLITNGITKTTTDSNATRTYMHNNSIKYACLTHVDYIYICVHACCVCVRVCVCVCV